MKTIYIVEWRAKRRGPEAPWFPCHDFQITRGAGYLESFAEITERVELFGSHDNIEYRIVPYVRGEI